MCGLAGSWRVPEWDVAGALEEIAHRGPDARGVLHVASAHACHGHVRLSILDPEPRSDQPFVEDGLTLSYNGECWNYRRLREELGGGWRTDGDTEVVARALLRWGPEALRQIDGQFALAWTDRRGRTFLARDRWGEVPLYMLREGDPESLLGGGVLWASERKVWGPRGAEAVPVPPGTYVELETGRVRAYYGRRETRTDYQDGPRYVRERLEAGTTDRLQSDVPVCCLLSGGLDSSAILALVKARAPEVVAYVASMTEESPDLLAARGVAEELDVELREVPVPLPTPGLVREAIRTIEIPMKAQVEIAHPCRYLAERMRRDGFRVCLSGEGADELFGGYGNLARKATSGRAWRDARAYSFDKMARGNFVRTNKTFMAHGVECRLPFMDVPLVEYVLSLGLSACPPGKELLKRAVRGLVPDEAVRRRKATFQDASGVSGWLEDSLGGRNRKVYNDVARDLFGGLPVG